MDEDFITEQVGHMVLSKNKVMGEIVSWSTISENMNLNIANRIYKVSVIISKEISLIKQVAKIKTMNLKLDIDDRKMINLAKSNGYINLGYYRPNEGEEISQKCIEVGLQVVVEDSYIDKK